MLGEGRNTIQELGIPCRLLTVIAPASIHGIIPGSVPPSTSFAQETPRTTKRVRVRGSFGTENGSESSGYAGESVVPR